MEIQNFVQQKPFGSLCLKCAACLAVADQIAQTVNKTLEEAKKNETVLDSINEELLGQIGNLCNKGFKNYDLRKYNEISIVTDRLRCTEHIDTKMDGNWTKKLRELCSFYISHMDVNMISNEYKDKKRKDLTTMLCSGSGMFRDCHNIEYNQFSESIDDLSCCDQCECGK